MDEQAVHRTGRGGPNLDAGRRREMGAAFQDGGEHYDRVRPGYPPASLDWLLAACPVAPVEAVDIGAGTGKYTALLLERGLAVTAVDPSEDMLAELKRLHPTALAVIGTAEHLALPEASMDLATVAQAWHWCDPSAASAAIARVLRPGGVLGLVWNQLDVQQPWVHRLSRIMHAGDVHKPGFRPALGPGFTGLDAQVTNWTQPMTPSDLLELAKSRSYYLRASEATRAKVLANLRWYLGEYLGHDDDDRLEVPYLTTTWRALRS